MSGNVKVILTNGKQDFELDFEVRNNPTAQKWFDEVSKDYEILEDDRFINWGSHNIIDEMNCHIDTVNSYDNIIDKKVSTTTTQRDLNYLHKFFEDLRGEIEESTDWFDSAPNHVKRSVERFNVLIHNLEEEIRQKDEPSITVTFKDKPRFILSQDDIKHFTYRWKYGTMYINYCHVGKPVLDVFKDRDNISDAVRPQTHYSADFFIKLGRTTPMWYYLIRKAIINVWLKFQKFKFKNPNIGMIPVADLITEIDTIKLQKYNRVKGVVCKV